MNDEPTLSSSQVRKWFQQQVRELWPAALGSISLRRSPCVRERCTACESGEQHQSYVLYTRVEGQRHAVYVPKELVGELEAVLERGRELQVLLHEAAVRYVKALKSERKRRRGSQEAS
jgi:hypothetical protein